MLAVLYARTGNLQDAVYYAKLSGSLGLDEATLALLPPALPSFAHAMATIRTAPVLAAAEALAMARIHREATKLYESHLTFCPDDVTAVRGLARSLLAVGQPMRALACLTDLEDKGFTASATDRALFGAAHAALGEPVIAEDYYRQAVAQAEIEAENETEIGCAWVRDAVFDPRKDESALADLARAWAAALPQRPRVAPVPVGDRPIRLGVLASAAGDVRDLEVAAAVLKGLDPRRVKRYVFGHGAAEDAANVGLRPAADQWQDIGDCDPYTLAAIIRGDEIDVVVDIGGHAAPVHLAALALRPAPWQVSWLGSGGPLGLAQIDVELAGAGEDESGQDQGGEGQPRRLVLADGLYCGTGPAPLARTALVGPGPLTFGADIGLPQLHSDLLNAWAQLLEQVPDAMLVLRDRGFIAGELVDHLGLRFAAAGIAHRIDLITAEPAAFYQQIDVALAPFVETNPHDTIAALSQGVPVIALAGAGRHRRQSAALLRGAGLGQWVATDSAGYVERAAALGRSLPAWQAAAATVAQTLSTAPLFQPARVAAGFQSALASLIGA
jgi:predicted O-linked N-acetylglucosamine transferase (SPINDLY family)